MRGFRSLGSRNHSAHARTPRIGTARMAMVTKRTRRGFFMGLGLRQHSCWFGTRAASIIARRPRDLPPMARMAQGQWRPCAAMVVPRHGNPCPGHGNPGAAFSHRYLQSPQYPATAPLGRESCRPCNQERPMAPRRATVNRDTLETRIEVAIDLDGSGQGDFATGVPFLEHMLDQIARHGLVDL